MIPWLLNIPRFLYLAASLVSMPLLQCQKQNQVPVNGIHFSTTGGRSGNYETLDIFPDSLVYMQAIRGQETYIRQKTSTDFWKGLTRNIDLVHFDKIKSSPGHALYDGIDITLEILTPGRKHTLINGHEDSANYEKLRPFTQLLDQKLESLRKDFTSLPDKGK